MANNKKTNLIRIKDIGKALGSRGGRATLKKYGKDYFKKLSELGVKARKEKKAEDTGTLSS